MNTDYLVAYGIMMTSEESDGNETRVIRLTGEAAPESYEQVRGQVL